MWRGIYGHDEIVERFRRTLAHGRLASTYLFVGPAGIGKRRFAVELARALLCARSTGASLEPCGECESCRLFAAANHPDLDIVALKPDKSELAISQFVGYDDDLKQEGLCHRIALKPFFGGRRIAIIDDADHFNLSSANCLLKTLEEPPPRSLLILIGTSPSRQLPTIRSRAQIVRFQPLDVDTVARILLESGLATDRDVATKAAELSEGSVERAAELVDPELWAFRNLLFAELRKPNSVRLARAVQAFVDEAGKESSEKRRRLRTILDFALAFYRKSLSGHAVRQSGEEMSLLGPSSEAAVGALDATLNALEQVDRNANLGLVIQRWSERIGESIGRDALISRR
jgi:DNA polymerase III subunit delta'